MVRNPFPFLTGIVLAGSVALLSSNHATAQVLSCGSAPLLAGPVVFPPLVSLPAPASSPQPAVTYGAGPASNAAEPGYYSEDSSGARATPTGDTQLARIRVRLPVDAELWIDGAKTTQAGAVREFITGKLDPERVYTFPVRARWVEDGITVEKSVKVKTFAGNRITINFVRPPVPQERQPVVRQFTPPQPPPQIEQRPLNWRAPVP